MEHGGSYVFHKRSVGLREPSVIRVTAFQMRTDHHPELPALSLELLIFPLLRINDLLPAVWRVMTSAVGKVVPHATQHQSDSESWILTA